MDREELPAKIRGAVSHNIEDLQALHELYPWIPGEEHIRPSDEIKEKKRLYLEEICNEWFSIGDYILHEIFSMPSKKVGTKSMVTNRGVSSDIHVFKPNLFPYGIEQFGGKHYVLWYGCSSKVFSDNEIASHIESAIKALLGDDANFDFAFYENPKMTLPEYFHVQVFWTSK